MNKVSFCGHYIIPGSVPYDAYHDLHLPHDPPLYPQLARVPKTFFTCQGKFPGYYADVESGCQVYIDFTKRFLKFKVLLSKIAYLFYFLFILGLSSLRAKASSIIFMYKRYLVQRTISSMRPVLQCSLRVPLHRPLTDSSVNLLFILLTV